MDEMSIARTRSSTIPLPRLVVRHDVEVLRELIEHDLDKTWIHYDEREAQICIVGSIFYPFIETVQLFDTS